MINIFKKQPCKKNQELLSAYIDNQLTGTEKPALEQHLKTCGVCNNELTSLQTTKRMLKQLPVALPRRSFTVTASRPVASTSIFGIFRLATLATAVILLLINAGDFFGVYPLTMPSAPPQISVPEVVETPALVPTRGSGQGRPDISMPLPVGGSTVDVGAVVTPAPENLPQSAQQSAPGVGGAAGEPGGQYLWPVRQVEIGLIFMVVILFILTLVARKKVYVKVKR
ncbi:MAG: zf-HC2 domain-containing protein [Dehalococcoidia bacterium]|nr:zf-HC2 domain-containing protein [Dehalococcoidia bacterium]